MADFEIPPEHRRRYDVVMADPAWPMYGSPTKHGAAAKHYDLMTLDEIARMPMRSLFRDPKRGALFVWATNSRLDLAFEANRGWGLHFRGVAFIWIKTRKDGQPLGPRGVPPTAVKHVTEQVLLFTAAPKGRPFPLLDFAARQLVFAPVGAHSRKPDEVPKRIVDLYGDRPRIELFARESRPGWAALGNEIGHRDP